MSPIALILCGGPAHTARVLGALSSACDLVHMACPPRQLPDLGALSASALERTPLLVLSGVRQNVYLNYLTHELLDQGIESMSVWVESRLPSSVDAGFHPFDLDLVARLETPAPHPVRRSSALVAHTLSCASELGAREGYRVELPLGELTLSTPPLVPQSEEFDCLAETKKAGERYCELFNHALPPACRRCGTPNLPGLSCVVCGTEPTLRRQTLLPDEYGYLAVTAGARDQVTARFVCVPTDCAESNATH